MGAFTALVIPATSLRVMQWIIEYVLGDYTRLACRNDDRRLVCPQKKVCGGGKNGRDMRCEGGTSVCGLS